MAARVVKPGKRVRKRPEAFHHGDLRAAAIHVAAREVEAHGHERVDLGRIAEKLGVTRPALYRHFADREDLLLAVTLAGFAPFAEALEASMRSGGGPWERLRACGRTYVRHARDHRGWFRLQFSQGQTARSENAHEQAPPAYVALMHEALGEAFGTTDPARLWGLFQAFWAQVHGLAALIVEEAFAFVPASERIGIADGALDLFLEGMRALAATGRAGGGGAA